MVIMDNWKYFDIIHRRHILCNPLSLAKFQQLIDLLEMSAHGQVLDIAAGKGEFILQMAERYGISGVAVDKSPYCIADMQTKLKQRLPEAQIVLLEMDGAEYRPDRLEQFDLAACIGASWIFDGYRGTLAALSGMTQPGGRIVCGEPYWLKPPEPAYLAAAGFTEGAFGTHLENVQIAEEIGLTLIYTLVSNHDDWDRYEALQWYAAEAYARLHPDDPDIDELGRRINESKHEYLTWGRNTLGWAIYVFQKP
jgi:cyclopropane fatty-acyl-phospholipid synthase-like methyltransferase